MLEKFKETKESIFAILSMSIISNYALPHKGSAITSKIVKNKPKQKQYQKPIPGLNRRDSERLNSYFPKGKLNLDNNISIIQSPE